MKEQLEFIIDTLETAIEWADYADDYFKKKHGLEQDRENVKKSIDMFRSLEQQNTALQARIKELEEPKMCDGCKHIKFSSPLNDFICEEGVANDISKLGSGCIADSDSFYCSYYTKK